MGAALYTNANSDVITHCPYEAGHAPSWLDDLPDGLKELVVAPVRFNVARDYELLADHTQGCDETNQPCYCEFRVVLTQLRSDDDEVFYEASVYAESLRSWRLVDDRWLVCRTAGSSSDGLGFHAKLSLSDAMPR